MDYSSYSNEVSYSNDSVVNATEDAKAQVESKHPCFKLNFTTINVPVSVSNYGRLTELESATQVLEKKQFTYFRELDGYLIGFENLSLANNYGLIHGDSPLILWPIKGDFYTFHPVVNTLIQGSIESFLGNCDDKVTCSISNGIRALVSFPTPIPKKMSPFIHLSSVIWFKIDKIDNKFCQMTGFITDEALEKMRKERKSNKRQEIEIE